MLIRTQIAIFTTLVPICLLLILVKVFGLPEYFQPILSHWLILLVAVLGLIGINYFVAFLTLRPLYKVVKEIEALNPGELGTRLAPRQNNDAVKWLIDHFNRLLGNLEELLNHQKMFISNVSHEVKNPLSSIINERDVTLTLERSSTEYRSTLKSIRESAASLSFCSLPDLGPTLVA